MYSDFFEYTKEWIDRVNRGGLFPLNDITYQFFIVIEQEVQVILPDHVLRTSKSKDDIQLHVIDKIVNNEDIQWYWTLLSQCIDAEDHAIELLQEIVKLWVTIRGFALAATWLEVYKKEKQKTTKKSTGLRKGLKGK